MKIELLSGDDCFEFFDNKEVVSEWKRLANCSEHLTLEQEYNFAVSWYLSYRDKYNPIILVYYNDDKNMKALMPLALSYESGKLSHAGDMQAEYNSWVCEPEYYEEFIIQSLIKIKHTLGIAKWDWTWIPYNSNYDWLRSNDLKKAGIYITSDNFNSPIYDLRDLDRVNKIKRSKSTKSKINRLNRQGELRIERITDAKVANKLFDRVINQSNFRHVALYNKMPFIRDKNRRDWYTKKIKEIDNNEHYTVLWQGDKILACNFGNCTDDTVVIGTFTYDPIQGGNSPGKIFIIKLIEFLNKNGYRYLDLSPGGDSYKEYFCNKHNSLVKPTIYFNKKEYIKNNIIDKKEIIKIIKRKVNSRNVATITSLWEKNLLSIVENKIINLHHNRMGRILTFDGYSIENKIKVNISNININKNKYEDLFSYENNGHLTLKEVVFSALRNFERGDILYTAVSQNILIGFIWVARSGKKHWNPCLSNHINNEKNSIYLYDFHINQDNNSNLIFKLLVSDILHEIYKEKFSNLYLVRPNNVDNAILKLMNFNSNSSVHDKNHN